MHLHLAIPDLFWPNRETLDAADPGRLPSLETLFARGRRKFAAASCLEDWLLVTWRVAGGGAAPYSLIADGGEPGKFDWLRADPCSFRVNRSELILLDASMFEVSRAEAEALAETLNRHFADAGLTFYPMQPERWYLRGSREDTPKSAESLRDSLFNTPFEHAFPPLGVARGKAIEVHPGTGAAHAHALMNEMQMVLHEHPINEAREARGQLPINSLWLWGAGRFAPLAERPFRRIHTRDPLAAGLAQASGAAVVPLPKSAEQWRSVTSETGVELAVLDTLRASTAYGDATTWRGELTALERDWIAPLVGELRTGHLGMITLHAIGASGTLDVEATRRDLRYFWRRAKPLASYGTSEQGLSANGSASS
jgi:hypothetical protein